MLAQFVHELHIVLYGIKYFRSEREGHSSKCQLQAGCQEFCTSANPGSGFFPPFPIFGELYSPVLTRVDVSLTLTEWCQNISFFEVGSRVPFAARFCVNGDD